MSGERWLVFVVIVLGLLFAVWYITADDEDDW